MRVQALAVAIGVMASSTSWAADAPLPDEASLRAASAREVAEFMAADTKGLADLWADTFVVNNPLNQLVTKPQVLGMVDSGMLRFTRYERTIEYVHAYGDIAVVAGAETVVWAGRMPLAGQQSHLRYMAVWRRGPGGWREVARQANVIPGP